MGEDNPASSEEAQPVDNNKDAQEYPDKMNMPEEDASVQRRPSRRTSAAIWEEVRQERRELNAKQCSRSSGPLFCGTNGYHPGCPHCEDRDREHIRMFRTLAQNYPNIYSWICLDPEDFQYRWPKDFSMVFLGVSIQVVVPTAIALQLYEDLDGILCIHRDPSITDIDMGKFLAFVLSFYFGVVSINTFLGKVRGNAFLMVFSSIHQKRKTILIIGFISQTLGLIAANIAEYLLFVSRGPDDFLTLLFTSLTMQSTMNADSNNLISTERSTEAETIIARIVSDEALDLGQDGEADLPKHLVLKLIKFRKVYDAMTVVLALFTLFLTAAVTHCI